MAKPIHPKDPTFPVWPELITPDHPHIRGGRRIPFAFLDAFIEGVITRSEQSMLVEVLHQMKRSRDGSCYATNATLGAGDRIGNRRVCDLLKSLTEKGWVERKAPEWAGEVNGGPTKARRLFVVLSARKSR